MGKFSNFNLSRGRFPLQLSYAFLTSLCAPASTQAAPGPSNHVASTQAAPGPSSHMASTQAAPGPSSHMASTQILLNPSAPAASTPPMDSMPSNCKQFHAERTLSFTPPATCTSTQSFHTVPQPVESPALETERDVTLICDITSSTG